MSSRHRPGAVAPDAFAVDMRRSGGDWDHSVVDHSDPAQWPYDPAQHPSPPTTGIADFVVAGLIVLAVIAGGFVYAGQVVMHVPSAATDLRPSIGQRSAGQQLLPMTDPLVTASTRLTEE